MAKMGIGRTMVLTTTGRRSGKERSVPVTPITVDGTDYVVAPYGSVGWVENVRAHPQATLRSGREGRAVRLVEVTNQAAEVVKAYYDREPFPRPYMDVPADPTVDDFAQASPSFPVFRIDT